MPRKKVGIALGGGAARGIAHIGVLEVLEREGIPIDIVAGTSAGAVIGALYCSGLSPLRLKEVIEGFDWNRRRKLLDISLPHTGFIAGEKLMHEVRELMGGDLKFEELQKPFACVACDLLTGEEAVMTKGPVADAVHASIAIPLVFQAVYRKGRYLVDGGLVNQVPVNVVKAMGAEYIIAVNVVPIHVAEIESTDGRKRGHRGRKQPPPHTLQRNDERFRYRQFFPHRSQSERGQYRYRTAHDAHRPGGFS